MYNKRLFNKVNDKKVLHKVKKQWVTISLAMLMMIGGGAVATHVSASANTTKPQVTAQAKKPSRNITDKANNLHKHLLVHAATKATAQKPKKVVNFSKLPNKKTNPVNKVNNVNKLHVNQSGLYRGNAYKRVTTPFNSVRINHKILLHSNINSVGSSHNQLGALYQGRVVRVVKAFEGYFNNDNYLRYEVPLTNNRNAFITGNPDFVSYVAPAYNYHFYQKKLNHFLAHSRIKGLNGVRKMAKEANRKHSKNYKTYMKLYVKAFTENEAYRRPVITAHHGHKAVAAKRENTNAQPSLENSLENGSSASYEAQSYAPASYTPAVVPTPYVPSVISPSNSASESSVAPSSASSSAESVKPSSASSSVSSSANSNSVSSNTSKASSVNSNSAKPSSVSSSASKQSINPSSTSSSASKASSASNNSKVSSSASKASSANSNSAQSSVSSSASKQSVAPSSTASSSAQSSSTTSSEANSSATNSASDNSDSSDTTDPVKVGPHLYEGKYYGLNYKYNKKTRDIEFTGGTLTWNGTPASDLSSRMNVFLGMGYNNPNIYTSDDPAGPVKNVKFDSDVDFSHVTNMCGMFNMLSHQIGMSDAGDVKSIIFPNSMNISHVTNMSYMFDDDEDLSNLYLPNTFNTSHVTDMSHMFEDDSHLKSLTLPNSFNTSNVTNMSNMFADDASSDASGNNPHGLQSLTLPSTFDTSHVTNMSDMFQYDTYLQSLTLPSSFDASHVTKGSNMFADDNSIKINISSPNTRFNSNDANTYSNNIDYSSTKPSKSDASDYEYSTPIIHCVMPFQQSSDSDGNNMPKAHWYHDSDLSDVPVKYVKEPHINLFDGSSHVGSWYIRPKVWVSYYEVKFPSDSSDSESQNSDKNSSDVTPPSDNQSDSNQSDSNQHQDPNKSASDSQYKKQDMNHVPVDTALFDEIKAKSTPANDASSDVTDTLFAARVAHTITDPLPLIMNSSDDQVYRKPIYIGHVGKNELNPSKLFDGDSDAKWMKSKLDNKKYEQIPDNKAYNFTYKGLDAKKDGKYYSMYIFTKSDISNAFSDLFSLDDVYETAAKVKDYTDNTSKYGTTEDKADKLKILTKAVSDAGKDGASLVDVLEGTAGDALKNAFLAPVSYPYYVVITRSSKPVNGPF